MMKKWFVASMLAFSTVIAQAGESQTRVLTSLDITQALGEALTENTTIQVVKVIPSGYAMRGHDSYLKKHHKTLLKQAENADAVLTLASVWTKDPLYKWARRGNIRVVSIDVAKPLDGYGAGVPLMEIDGSYSPYVWRSPTNLTRMAAITAEDLARLVPGEAKTIRLNLRKLQSALFLLRSKYEAALLELESVDLAALTARNAYLTDEFGLDVHFYFLKPENEWNERDLQQLRLRLKENSIRGVLCAWAPEEATLQAIKHGGAVPVILEQFIYDGEKAPVSMLTNWYEFNLGRLLRMLKDK